MILLFLMVFIQYSHSDWVSEWLTPIELQNKEVQFEKNTEAKEAPDMFETTEQNFDAQTIPSPKEEYDILQPSTDYTMNTLKMKLESTLQSAEELAEVLKKKIVDLETKERKLKEAIAYGKSGVTTLTISSDDKSSRSYIIRDGFWTLCSGLIQNPIMKPSPNIFNEIFSTPRCIGQELPSVRDPCAFNSIIKYETIPTTRRAMYEEDDYLCLKTNFNTSLEHYSSVPKGVVKDTCHRGRGK